MLGNFIADHVRGNQFSHFSKAIQKGIFLHRNIDTFTDTNKIVRNSKRRLHERYGHYDGIIIDIFYDHFLAKNWKKYSQIPLKIYTQSVYRYLQSQNEILPKKTKELLPYMIQYDWLYNYQFIDGIQKVMNGMNRRTKGKSQMHLSVEDLILYYEIFEKDFESFMNELIEYVSLKLVDL